MCNAKPGLRCANHAKSRVESLQDNLSKTSKGGIFKPKQRERYTELRNQLAEAKLEYRLTDQGIEEYRQSADAESIQVLENIRNSRNDSNAKFAAVYQSKSADLEQTVATGNSEQLEKSAAELNAQHKYMMSHLMYRINHPHEQPFPFPEELIGKTAEVKAERDHIRNDAAQKSALEEKLANDPTVSEFLKTNQLTKDEFVQRSLETTRKLENLKASGVQTVNTSDFTDDKVTAVILNQQTSRLENGESTSDLNDSPEDRAARIVNSVKQFVPTEYSTEHYVTRYNHALNRVNS